MRTLKFRAWNDIEMMPCEVIDGKAAYNINGGVYFWPIQPDTIDQFTGLKDKNGAEIYEGDVVNTVCKPYGFTPANYIHWNNVIVRWLEKEARFSFATNDLAIVQDHDCYEIEVIGNIHENPELLENK